MPLTYVASLSPMALCPSVALSLGLPSMSMSAKLSGALALNASLTSSPPTVSSTLTINTDLIAGINRAIAAIPPVVTMSFDASAAASLVATFSLAPSFLAILQGLFAASVGIYCLPFVGIGSSFGAAVTTELATTWPDGASSSGACNAIILGATSPVARLQLPAYINGVTFSAGLTYGGKIGLTAMCPVVSAAFGQAGAAIGVSAAAAAKLQASLSILPPTFPAQLLNLARFAANIGALPSLKPPTAALAASAAMAADVQANFGACAALGAALNKGGSFFVYTYSGNANAMGAALTTALGSHWGDGFTSSSGACTAIALGTTDSLAQAALTGFMGGA